MLTVVWMLLAVAHSAEIAPTIEGIYLAISEEAANNNGTTQVVSQCSNVLGSYEQSGCCDLEGNATIKLPQTCLSDVSVECLAKISGRDLILSGILTTSQVQTKFSIAPVNETLELETWYDTSTSESMILLPFFTNSEEALLEATQCPVGFLYLPGVPPVFDDIETILLGLDGFGIDLPFVYFYLLQYDQQSYNITNEILKKTPDVERIVITVIGNFPDPSLGLPPAIFTLENLKAFQFDAFDYNQTLINDLISLDVPNIGITYFGPFSGQPFDGLTDFILPIMQSHTRTGVSYKGYIDVNNVENFTVPAELATELTHFVLSTETDSLPEQITTFPEFISNFTNLVGLVIVDNNENSGVVIVDDYPESYSALADLIALKINVQQITSFANFSEIHPNLLFLQADFFQSSPVTVPDDFFLKQYGEVRIDGELQIIVDSDSPICSTPNCNFDFTGELAFFMCESPALNPFCCGKSCIPYSLNKITEDSTLETLLTTNGFEIGVNASFNALLPSVVKNLDVEDSGTSLDTEWIWNLALLKVATASDLKYSLNMSTDTTLAGNAMENVLSTITLNPRAFELTFPMNSRYSQAVLDIFQRCDQPTAFRFTNFAPELLPSGFSVSLSGSCFFIYVDFGDFGDVEPLIINSLWPKRYQIFYYRHLQSSSVADYGLWTSSLQSGGQYRHLELSHSNFFSVSQFPSNNDFDPSPIRTLILRHCPVVQFTDDAATIFHRLHTLHMIDASYNAVFPSNMWELNLINVDLSNNPDMTGNISRVAFERSYERFSIENTKLNGTVFSTDPICSNPPENCHLSSYITCGDGPYSCNCTGGGPSCYPDEFILEQTGFQSMSAGMGETLFDVFSGDFWNTTQVYCVTSIESGQLKFRYYTESAAGSSPEFIYFHATTGVQDAKCDVARGTNPKEWISCAYRTSSNQVFVTGVRFDGSAFQTIFNSFVVTQGVSIDIVEAFRIDFASDSRLALFVGGSNIPLYYRDGGNGGFYSLSSLENQFSVDLTFPVTGDTLYDVKEADFDNNGEIDHLILAEDSVSEDNQVRVHFNGNSTAGYFGELFNFGQVNEKIIVGQRFSNSSVGPDFAYRRNFDELVICYNYNGDGNFTCELQDLDVTNFAILTTTTNMLNDSVDGLALRVDSQDDFMSYITIIEEGFQTFSLSTPVPNKIYSTFVPKGPNNDDYTIVYVDRTANTLNWANFDIAQIPFEFV